ncbi:aldo/keto reductase [Flavitalea sp. BT771]|uniref:aldo/keto reductase n=1 Tax=Flavitalea sp. BT771 TaxID=3063329 RepID=UPI0026E38A3B|nr:aldo/keto reductase [Flavitalea sp. BT771]MDO6432691.1 aldo/keto reductase [Flavitalea sp. BT771]MDV6222033.1 aldo/keto reductase [Flavitalea sp. BT771]
MQQYRTLGKSGLRVSPLCLGGMTFGEDWGWGADEKQSEQIIRTFTDAGGNFIDTASVYTNGHSEKIIGDVVGSQSSLRTKTVIGTKFSGNIYPGDPNGGGTGTKAIVASCHQSLRRLQTDYIDLFSIHQWDWNTPLEEVMRTLDNLVSSGKVRYIGVSYAPAWKIAQAQTFAALKDWTPFIALQVEYSLLARTIEDELVPMAIELGLGITPWSPLKGGLLSGKYNPSMEDQSAGTRMGDTGRKVTLSGREIAMLDQLRKIADAHDTTVAAVSLAWVLSRPGVSAPIIGIRKQEQLEANIAAVDVDLSTDEIRSLDDLSNPPASFVTEYREAGRMFHHGGIEVNGYKPAVLPLTRNMVPGRY